MAIDNILMFDETIFKDTSVFDPDYMPDKFLHRNSQLDALAICLRPMLRGSRPMNAIIVGSCATGKTTAVKKIFEKIGTHSDRVVCVYLNCQIHNTKYAIFSQIYQEVFGISPPHTGRSFPRIYGEIMQELQNTKRGLVVALDDVDYLFHNKNANEIFYDILRAHEEYQGVKTGLFAIISDIEFRYILDKNVNSIFIPQEIIFDPYSFDDMKQILSERVEAGFYPGVISEKILNEITHTAMSMGDLRVGIDLLRVVGNNAEADASRTIEEKHLEAALVNTDSSLISLRNTITNLSKNEKSLLKIIVKNDYCIAGSIYKQLNNINPLSYTTFDRLLKKLEFLRLIDIQFTGKGMKGNSRVIILRFDSEEVERYLK